jgi:hypothetical protein
MKYDDASWHYGGSYPGNLSAQNAFTHIGMFLAWALLNDLGGEIHFDELKDELELLQARRITPGRYFRQNCDGKLTDEDLNDRGNRFAEMYYEKSYLQDYVSTLASELESPYHVDDTWENFEEISQVISRRFDAWVSNT